MSANKMKVKIMAHMIPYYPDLETSRRAAQVLAQAGIDYFEIQFPFSDPTADGPAIEAACTLALEQGFTVDAGFDFVKELGSLGKPVFIMTYASLVYARGVEKFCQQAKEAGAQGLIIPDLPADSDEGLAGYCRKHGLIAVPVLVPTTTDTRLDLLLSSRPAYVYCALRTGITGTRTELGQENQDFLKKVSTRVESYGGRILAGFGIQEASQVQVLQAQVYSVVVGSAFVRILGQGGPSSLEELDRLVRSLRPAG